MSEELKPCRRCGGSDDDLLIAPEDDESGDYVIGYWVICECGLSVHARGDYGEAIRKWNEWPAEDALRTEVLRLNAQYYEMETYGCPDCNGDGEINGNTCFTCNGHGVLYVKPKEATE